MAVMVIARNTQRSPRCGHVCENASLCMLKIILLTIFAPCVLNLNFRNQNLKKILEVKILIGLPGQWDLNDQKEGTVLQHILAGA